MPLAEALGHFLHRHQKLMAVTCFDRISDLLL
jgi:hypothetical protein